MTFDQYWNTDAAFAYRHADEEIQAREAWNAALRAAAESCAELDFAGSPVRSCIARIVALESK